MRLRQARRRPHAQAGAAVARAGLPGYCWRPLRRRPWPRSHTPRTPSRGSGTSCNCRRSARTTTIRRRWATGSPSACSTRLRGRRRRTRQLRVRVRLRSRESAAGGRRPGRQRRARCQPLAAAVAVAVIAEFWADGPDSELPPGHWNTLANYVTDHPLLERRLGGAGPRAAGPVVRQSCMRRTLGLSLPAWPPSQLRQPNWPA